MTIATRPLLTVYEGQTSPQGAYIALDEDGNATADWNAEIGNAVPMDVFHGRTIRWSIHPELTAKQIEELLSDLSLLLVVVHNGQQIEWDGNNNVGKLSAEAQEASDKIAQLCADTEPEDWDWEVDGDHPLGE